MGQIDHIVPCPRRRGALIGYVPGDREWLARNDGVRRIHGRDREIGQQRHVLSQADGRGEQRVVAALVLLGVLSRVRGDAEIVGPGFEIDGKGKRARCVVDGARDYGSDMPNFTKRHAPRHVGRRRDIDIIVPGVRIGSDGAPGWRRSS